MTGYSKTEINENGIAVTVEIKSLNGRFLEISCRMPKQLQHKEIEIRELIKLQLIRGSISVNINIEQAESETEQTFNLNLDAAEACYNTLNELRKRLKIKSVVDMKDVLVFADRFQKINNVVDEEMQSKLIIKGVREAIKSLDNMRRREGTQISKDIFTRMKKIQDTVKKIEVSGAERIPQEREKLRQRVAQLFESDEYDEQRIQMEMVLLADKLDISEECVRLNSHFKFFHESLKGNESPGRKINFLLQEMNREINTIGSKINDANISQLVVIVKEELERVREQFQNIE